MRLRRRVPSHEAAHGFPGFPFHQATTEDLTQDVERFVLRPIKELPGQYRVDFYRSDFATIAPFKKPPRTRLGRKLRTWGYL